MGWFRRVFFAPLVDRKGQYVATKITRRELDLLREARFYGQRFIPETPIVISAEADRIRSVLMHNAEKRSARCQADLEDTRRQLRDAERARDDLLHILSQNLNCTDGTVMELRDATSPSWWRGHDYAADALIRSMRPALLGDDKAGVFGHTGLEALYQAILKLARKGIGRYRHIKRDKLYLALYEGTVQTSRPLHDMDRLVAYMDGEGEVWFRPPEELSDPTRFVRLG